MSDFEVRIVRLEAMRVASAHGFGSSPEAEAWDKIKTFAQAKGLKQGRFFGFNNPSPSAGSPNYGYEQWITVDATVQPEGDIQIRDVPGGLYAVTRCTLSNIGEAWQRLVLWHEGSAYKRDSRLCLEESINPEIFMGEDTLSLDELFAKAVFDLYEPIAE